MRTALPLIALFVVGLSLGSGSTTLIWSGMLDRSRAQTATANRQAKEALAVAQKNLDTANSCIDTLKRHAQHR